MSNSTAMRRRGIASLGRPWRGRIGHVRVVAKLRLIPYPSRTVRSGSLSYVVGEVEEQFGGARCGQIVSAPARTKVYGPFRSLVSNADWSHISRAEGGVAEAS
jgi:hypothetical protein